VKVLLVYPDFTVDLDPATKRLLALNEGGWYSEGLASIAAVLRGKGHTVALYHITAPVEREAFTARLRDEAPDVVGFTAVTRCFHWVKEYARWTKQTLKAPIICGGYHPNSFPEEVAQVEEIDVIAIGEGEETIAELCERTETGRSYDDLPGAWVRVNGQIVRNPARLLVTDLDAMPLPDFDIFDFNRLVGTGIGSAIANPSRGCPFSCTYCINPRTRSLYANRKHYWRLRTPQRSIEYLEKLATAYPKLQVIHFCNDIFAPDIPWLEEFTTLYRRKIARPFTCNHRVNLITPELLRLLREAGCYQMFLGIESGNDRIRNQVLNRSLARETILRAFKQCREAGIHTVAYNMIGLPFEDKRAILDTIRLNAEARADHSLCPIFYPYPGTRLHEVSVEHGFAPAVFDYREAVVLVQPTLSQSELFFTRYYFRLFVTLYRLAFRFPGPLRRLGAAFLNAVFLSPVLPRRPLIALARGWEAAFVALKNWARQRMPRMYKLVRDRVRGVRTAETPPPEMAPTSSGLAETPEPPE